jgi:hypothetical protein
MSFSFANASVRLAFDGLPAATVLATAQTRWIDRMRWYRWTPKDGSQHASLNPRPRHPSEIDDLSAAWIHGLQLA